MENKNKKVVGIAITAALVVLCVAVAIPQPSPFILINGDAELADTANRGSGTKEDPYVIENRRIDLNTVEEGKRTGIVIGNVTAYLIIQNCRVTTKWSGIYIQNSNNVVVRGNTISAENAGIVLFDSNHTTVDDNIIRNAEYGILTGYSSYNKITTNTIEDINESNDFGYGIYLRYGSHNEIRNNVIRGPHSIPYTQQATSLIMLYDSHNNTIETNEVFQGYFGVFVQVSTNNTIRFNDISWSPCGLSLCDSPFNIITGNTFYRHERGCYIMVTENNWYYSRTGLANANTGLSYTDVLIEQ